MACERSKRALGTDAFLPGSCYRAVGSLSVTPLLGLTSAPGGQHPPPAAQGSSRALDSFHQDVSQAL